MLFIMQKVLRADSYSTVSYSAWSRACDPCMFSPEKISPDSLLEGEYMLDGMFVFFICSLSLPRVFLHPFFSLLCAFYDDSFFSLRVSVWSPSPIYISVPFSDFFSFCFSFCFGLSAVSLMPSCQCSVSCGGGVQTRSIQCLRQGRPAAGCLSYQRPITSRACNTQFCPAAPPAPAQSPGRVTAVGPTLKGKFIWGKETNSFHFISFWPANYTPVQSSAVKSTPKSYFNKRNIMLEHCFGKSVTHINSKSLKVYDIKCS